uniref:Enoyl reductase (ER) domain-containing protein n=1 Tax=Zea mays TaxID=4577 RepID=C0P730_MAIZE|nr:unknown [Zea mays]
MACCWPRPPTPSLLFNRWPFQFWLLTCRTSRVRVRTGDLHRRVIVFAFWRTGFDLAGEVVELGAGVSSFKPGDKVIAINFPNGGGLAEYAVASASRTAARPPEVSAVEGVCVPIAAVTALGSLRTAGVTVTLDDPARAPATPKNVLVTAASGAVGHFAVQLARMGGHNVTATCGARNLGLVRSLGADEALDYKTPEGAKLRSPSGRKYDAVVHCAAKGLPWSVFRPVLAASGTVVDITPGFVAVVTAILQVATFSKKRLVPLIVTPKKEEMELLLGMLKQGRLKTVIDSRHPLGSAHEGWAKSMSGHATGKVVIEIGAAQP